MLLVILGSKRIIGLISSFNKSAKNKYLYLISFIIIIFAILGISYKYYDHIIMFLKSSSITSWLSILTTSRQDTYYIFIAAILVLSIYLITIISYYLWQSSIENKLSTISDKINFRIIKLFGIITIVITLSFNIFILGYKKLNTPVGPNIVLITIDTLRADRLAAYGHERNTSPNIDSLAEKGVLFEKAISQAPWTLPSIVSIFSGLYPSEIGTKNINSNMKYETLTLTEYMKNNFYNTIAVISHIVVSKSFGFAQGFDTFNQEHIAELDEISSEAITQQAIKYLSSMKNDKFFLWLHYFDPHHNYIDHNENNYTMKYNGSLPDNLNIKMLNKIKSNLDNEDIEYTTDVYDEEIAYTDKQIGVLIEAIEDLGLSDDTVIVLTSDHGEEFMERSRFGHGRTLYQELIHVPLVIYNPHDNQNKGKKIADHVEIRNIAKTIIELSGLSEELFEGLNLLDERTYHSNHIVISENYGYDQGYRRETIIYKNWKLISNLDDQTFELYKIDADGGEKNNLFLKDNKEINTQKQKLQAMLSVISDNELTESGEAELSRDDIKQLKALGYIQ